MTLFHTHFYIAHGKIVSIYNVEDRQWMKNLAMPDEIFTVCRNEKGIEKYFLGIICKNGNIHEIYSTDDEFVLKENVHQLKANVSRVIFDWRNMNSNGIIVDGPKGKEIYFYSVSVMKNITKDIENFASTISQILNLCSCLMHAILL